MFWRLRHSLSVCSPPLTLARVSWYRACCPTLVLSLKRCSYRLLCISGVSMCCPCGLMCLTQQWFIRETALKSCVASPWLKVRRMQPFPGLFFFARTIVLLFNSFYLILDYLVSFFLTCRKLAEKQPVL